MEDYKPVVKIHDVPGNANRGVAVKPKDHQVRNIDGVLYGFS